MTIVYKFSTIDATANAIPIEVAPSFYQCLSVISELDNSDDVTDVLEYIDESLYKSETPEKTIPLGIGNLDFTIGANETVIAYSIFPLDLYNHYLNWFSIADSAIGQPTLNPQIATFMRTHVRIMGNFSAENCIPDISQSARTLQELLDKSISLTNIHREELSVLLSGLSLDADNPDALIPKSINIFIQIIQQLASYLYKNGVPDVITKLKRDVEESSLTENQKVKLLYWWLLLSLEYPFNYISLSIPFPTSELIRLLTDWRDYLAKQEAQQ